jgi:hypothetical protein
MNMGSDFGAPSLGAMDVIVLVVALFTVIFVAAWILSPSLRKWIERPKYRFLADVEGYDRAQQQGGPLK